MLFISCVCHAFAAMWLPTGKGLTLLLLFVMSNCDLLLSHLVILGQVWYLIVSISDPSCLSYFKQYPFHRFVTYISNSILCKVSELENKLLLFY